MSKEKNLYYLTELPDYKISSGYPDVRGWEVKDFDNRVIGTVDNLLVDKVTERVVYLDVEVDETIIDARHDPYGGPANSDIREFVNKDGENHVIVPIGLVDLHNEHDYVFTGSIDHRTFAETKRIRKGVAVDRDYEVVVLDSYGRRRRGKRLNPQEVSEYERDHLDGIDEDENRLERIKERDHIGEFRKLDEKEDVDWYDAENEDIEYGTENPRFYHRREFDDSRFRRRKDL